MISFAPTLNHISHHLNLHPRIKRVTLRLFPKLELILATHSLRDAAAKSWIIHPSEERYVEPAIFNKDDLIRVTDVDSDSSIEKEHARIKGGLIVYRPTTAYQLNNVILDRGHVYLPGFSYRITNDELPYVGRYDHIVNDTSFLISSYNTTRYFGHWLLDELPRILLSSDLGLPVAPCRALSKHQCQYLDLMSFSFSACRHTLFDRLVIIDERSQNSNKRARISAIRNHLRALHKSERVASIVMLERKNTGNKRLLLNESELSDCIRKLGGFVISPLDYQASEILKVCYDADIVIGVEGSQLCYALLAMKERGTLLVLQPPYRFNNILKPQCDALNMRYAFVVGHRKNDGFIVHPDQLYSMLDILDRKMQSYT